MPLSSSMRFNFFKPFIGNKLLLKQTYLLLSWFFYTSFIKKKKKISIFCFPSTKIIFTNTKAPMAHKKNSKEQFQYKYFNFKLSFEIYYYFPTINNLNFLLFFFLFNKKNFFYFETNLFFLKNFYIYMWVQHKEFFNFHSYLKI